MYYSPVPLLIIRADAPALIEVNGHPAGECGADSHIALPLSDSRRLLRRAPASL